MRTTLRRWINTATPLALGLIGFACVPLFEHPLPADAVLKADPALVGTWSGLQADDGSQLSLFPRLDGWLDIMFITDINAQSERGAKLEQYEGYTTTVADERFLCFREVGGDATNRYLLARYRIHPPARLSIQVFEQDALRILIKSGKLQGRIDARTYGDSVTVTASPAHLAAAILSEGVNAFVSTNMDLRFARMGVLPADVAPVPIR